MNDFIKDEIRRDICIKAITQDRRGLFCSLNFKMNPAKTRLLRVF
jgi:hypothetical protein